MCAVLGKTPDAPLAHAHCTFTRFSSKRPDYDGLVHSMKPVLDGLVKGNVLVDDSYDVIGVPQYLWEYVDRNNGHIQIQVEEE